MLVLGWHGNALLRGGDDCAGVAYHDGAAAILQDGVVLAAIEEERINRTKHSNAFPAAAIRFCLSQAKVALGDVDAIVTDCTEQFHDLVLLREAAENPARPRWTSRRLITSAFEREFGLDVSSKLRYCKHHTAHLCAAWYPSGFEEALAVCLDGDGDGSSGLIAHCTQQQMRVLRLMPDTLSLGNFYTTQLSFLGYRRFDEYKVMGLAPYGDPQRFADLFKSMYELLAEGRYTLASETDRLLLMNEAGLAVRARRKGEQFTREHMDYAASLQAALEDLALHIVDHFRRTTGARRLCMSGGVAHNCTLNGRLLLSRKFAEMYVQPAAHDAGNAIGAAWSVCRASGSAIPRQPMPHLFLGTDIPALQLAASLQRWHGFIQYERVDCAATAAAARIAAGEVIAWVQGRSEFGPRALGNRSIVADPRPASNRELINSMVKNREDYRPFAPSVLIEHARDYFELPPGTDGLPYMVVVVPVRPQMRAVLGAVTHVDGSARVQTVARQENLRYYQLIETFHKLTGVPVVLNTSFNNDAEPIVDCVDDAITTLLTTRINALVIGDWLVRKSCDLKDNGMICDLVVRIPAGRKLVHRPALAPHYALESVTPEFVSRPVIEISRTLFSLLATGRCAPIRHLCAQSPNPVSEDLLAKELFGLWTARAIVLLPDSATGSRAAADA